MTGVATTVITDAGITAAINAASSGPQINITSFQIGSDVLPLSEAINFHDYTGVWSGGVQGSAIYTGSAAQLSYEVIDANTCRFKVTLDEAVGDFDIGNIGLFTNTGQLFSITALPVAEPKRATDETAIGSRRIFNIILRLSQISVISNFTVQVDTFGSLPQVTNELALPPANVAPYNTYALQELQLGGLGKSGLAYRFNSQWHFLQYADNYNDIPYQKNQTAQFKAFNGNPNGFVSGTEGGVNQPPTFCWDYLNQILFVCTQSGTAGSAAWNIPNIRLADIVDLEDLTITLSQISDLGDLTINLDQISDLEDLTITLSQIDDLESLTISISQIGDIGTLTISISQITDIGSLTISVSQISDIGTLTIDISQVDNIETLTITISQIGDIGSMVIDLSQIGDLGSLTIVTGQLTNINILVSDVTYYVNPAGNNANSGTSPASPWQTLAFAQSFLNAVVLFRSYTARIEMAPGTYDTGFVATQGNWLLIASSGNVLDTTIDTTAFAFQDGVHAAGDSTISVYNITVRVHVNRYALAASGKGLLMLPPGNTIRVGSADAQIAAFDAGVVQIGCHIIINENAQRHLFADGGTIVASAFSTPSVTTTTITTAMTIAFATCIDGGFIRAINGNYGGAAIVGKRFQVFLNGVINSGGQDKTTYFPGDAPGEEGTGGLWA